MCIFGENLIHGNERQRDRQSERRGRIYRSESTRWEADQELYNYTIIELYNSITIQKWKTIKLQHAIIEGLHIREIGLKT